MIETVFTIRNVSVDKALQEAEKKVDRSAQRMDTSLNKVGKDSGKKIGDSLQQASKGMDAVQKAGGKVGGVLKNLTEGFAGMLNPIGLVTAGITGVIALVVRMYETAQARIQALIHSSEYFAQKAKDDSAKLGKEQETDTGYMRRLVEINGYETIDNATKEESIRIINILTSKYGDLGLSIDATTGKIVGLTEATERLQKQQLDQQKTEKAIEVNRQRDALYAQEREIMPRNPTEGEIRRIFGGPKTRAEWMEDITSSMVVTQSKGMTQPNRPLRDAREKRAQTEYDLYSGKRYDPSSDIAPLLRQNAKEYQEALIKSQSPSIDENLRASYKREMVYLKDIGMAMMKTESALKMQGVWANDEKEFEKWRKVFGKAYEYYNLMQDMVRLERAGRPTTTDPNDPLIKKNQAEAQKLLHTYDAVKKERDAVFDRRATAQKQYDQVGMSKEDLKRGLEQENWDYSDKIYDDQKALEKLKKEYDDLNTKIKEYDQYKTEQGDIEDKAKNAEYLDISNKLTENKIKQAEKEAEIAKAQTEQLGIQSKLKQYQEELNKLERERIKEQAKKTLKWLFSGVLGDLKETTNSLTQRGGYLSGVNTMNALQINKQILNTVITANNYLSSIKNQLNNVGKI